MQNLIIFAQGKPSEKLVNGNAQLVTPFAGKSLFGMGVGLQGKEGSSFWRLASPCLPITSWRAMKIAELVKEFGDGTLAACWYSGKKGKSSNPSEAKLIEEIEFQIGKPARRKILGAKLTRGEIDGILSILMKNKINFSGYEIKQEAGFFTGAVPRTAMVKEYLAQYGRHVELANLEDSGMFIPVDEARIKVSESMISGKDALGWFLQAFDSLADLSTLVAIKHNDMSGAGGVHEIFILGKSKAEPDLTLVLNAGTVDALITIAPKLSLTVLDSGILAITDSVALTEKLSTGNSSLASVSLTGSVDSPNIKIDVQDKRARALALELSNSITQSKIPENAQV